MTDLPTVKLLQQAAQPADRVVVSRSSDEPGVESAPFEVRGYERIRELVHLLEFEPAAGGFEQPCLCLGTHRFEFYRGDDFKFDLTYHHWIRLRAELGGPWLGDATITEAAAVRLIDWFATRGYTDPRDERARSDAWQQEQEKRFHALIARFPSEARAWFLQGEKEAPWGTTVDQRARQLAALYLDRTDLLLAIWGALGWLGQDGRRLSLRFHREPESFLLKAAATVTSDDVTRAMTRVTDTSTRLGALSHAASADSLREPSPFTAEVQVALLRHYLDQSPKLPRHEAVGLLVRLESPDADELLLEIAGDSFAEDATGANVWLGRPDLASVLQLSRRRVADVQPVIAEKLATATSPNERLVLQIAHAAFDPAIAITPEHLSCAAIDGDAAKLAWDVLKQRRGYFDTRDATPIELLAAAARSPSFDVSREAERQLASLGLERLEQKPDATDTAAALRNSIQSGNYAAARAALLQTDDDLPYERALSALALGRYSEAATVPHRATSNNESLAQYLAVSGALWYSLGEFAEAHDDFVAARQLNDNDHYLILRHLTLLHLGRGTDSRLHEWQSMFAGDDDVRLADRLILFLQGALSRDELLQAPEGKFEKAADRSLVRFVLSVLARLDGDALEERFQLEASLDAKAYGSIPHVLALRRLTQLEDERIIAERPEAPTRPSALD